MTDKEAVMDALRRLPENVSFEEITDELQIMAAVRQGRADIRHGRARSQTETEQMLTSWATEWNTK